MIGMDTLKRWWKSVPTLVRQVVIFIIGTVTVIIGIILVPLPGPGWVIIFAGFAILATEFAYAEKVRAWLVKTFKDGWEQLKTRWRPDRTKRDKPAKTP